MAERDTKSTPVAEYFRQREMQQPGKYFLDFGMRFSGWQWAANCGAKGIMPVVGSMLGIAPWQFSSCKHVIVIDCACRTKRPTHPKLHVETFPPLRLLRRHNFWSFISRTMPHCQLKFPHCEWWDFNAVLTPQGNSQHLWASEAGGRFYSLQHEWHAWVPICECWPVMCLMSVASIWSREPISSLNMAA